MAAAILATTDELESRIAERSIETPTVLFMGIPPFVILIIATSFKAAASAINSAKGQYPQWPMGVADRVTALNSLD